MSSTIEPGSDFEIVNFISYEELEEALRESKRKYAILAQHLKIACKERKIDLTRIFTLESEKNVQADEIRILKEELEEIKKQTGIKMVREQLLSREKDRAKNIARVLNIPSLSRPSETASHAPLDLSKKPAKVAVKMNRGPGNPKRCNNS